MNEFIKNGNSSISLNEINAIMAFASLISAQFYVRSFTVISDMKLDSFVSFQKVGLKHNLEMTQENYFDESRVKKKEKKAFLILNNRKTDFIKAMKTRPILTAGIFFTKEKQSRIPEYLLKLLVPHSTSFFIIQLFQNLSSLNLNLTTSSHIMGKSFVLYKPISAAPSKIFPFMWYGNSNQNNQRWRWIAKEKNWNFIKKEIRNMKGIIIKIALASHRDKNTTTRIFLKGKNSFFWRALEEHLKFKAEILYEPIVNQTAKSVTSVYLKLLMTNADGLGVLPALSSERTQYLDYIVTGIDSKYHLMVRTPQYVHSWQSIFKPFTPQLWICLGFAIFLMSIILRVVAYCQNCASMDFSSCFLTIFGFVCCQGSAVIPNKMSIRLVCYTALVLSFSIYQFYTSNFYSLLSTKVVSLPFTSLEQLLATRTHSLYMHPDTAIYSEIMKAKNGTFKRLREEIFNKDPKHQLKPDTRGASLEKVCKGKGAVLGLPFQTMFISELQCEIVPVNSGYFPTNVILVLKKQFPFKSQFKFVILRLLESGISHKFNTEELNVYKKTVTKTNVINEPVSLEHVAFLLVFYAASLLLSIAVLGLEILGHRSFERSLKKNTLCKI